MQETLHRRGSVVSSRSSPVLAIVAILSVVPSLTGGEFMMRAEIDGETIEGKPLAWNDSQMLLLGRDGRLHDFNPKKAKRAQKTNPSFHGYSSSDVRRQLQREFDKRFEVSMTRHYLVVHPAGERDQWAGRFEDLYKRFIHYFRVRGFAPEEPPYPLVAIVFRNQHDYFQYAENSGISVSSNTLGHYDPVSNRIFLYDVTADAPGVDWSENAAVIIHEATHQTAYNVGIHRRFAEAPRWLVEGLATMFEARGVWNARYDRTQADRINYERLRDFKNYVTNRRQPGALSQILSSDRAFQSDPIGAYAEAWALSFFLCETRPRLYAEYLQKVADRPRFSKYPPAKRMSDFQEVFGSELRMLETKFLRYMEEID